MSKIKISVKMKPQQATCTLNGELLTCWSDGRVFHESGRQVKVKPNKKNGYCHMTIKRSAGWDKKGYLMHRVIYYAFNPSWDITDSSQDNSIDHNDNNKSNNRLSNLRIATHSQNQYNSGAYVTSRTGIKGLSPYYSKKDDYWGWSIVIRAGGKTVYEKKRKVANGPIPDILPDPPQDLVDLLREKQRFYHGEFFHE